MATMTEWEKDVKQMSTKKLQKRVEALEELLTWKTFDKEYGQGCGVRVLRTIANYELMAREREEKTNPRVKVLCPGFFAVQTCGRSVSYIARGVDPRTGKAVYWLTNDIGSPVENGEGEFSSFLDVYAYAVSLTNVSK